MPQKGPGAGKRAAPVAASVGTATGGNTSLHSIVGDSPTTTVIIGGKKVQALVDTGSQVSMMTEATYTELMDKDDQPIKPLHHCLHITAANGLEVPYVGYFEVDIEVEGKILEKRGILVSKNSKKGVQPLILGMNVLRDAPPTLYSVPQEKKSETKFARVARLATTFIPAQSIAMVRATGAGRGRGRTLLFEPLQTGPKPGLVLPSALVETQGNGVWLRVINFSAQGVLLRPGARLGTLEEVENISDPNVTVEVECNRIHVSCAQVIDSQPSSAEQKPASTPLDIPVDLSGCDISEEEKTALAELLSRYADLFFKQGDKLGYTDWTRHRMNMQHNTPLASHFRRLPPSQIQEVREHIQGLVEQGIVQKSSSPYASPVVVCRKKNGSIRLTVDYRRLNAITKKDAYPLPRIDDSLDALGGACLFSSLDAQSGYYQIPMAEEDREKTAFITPFGLFEYLRMPMGLTNAPATFQRLMQTAMNDLTFQIMLVYLDDLLVYGKTFQEHLEQLKTVFDRLREVGLKLNPEKCTFCRKEVEFLGFTVSEEGIHTSKSKIQAVNDWPAPKTLKELRSFLGFASYYRRFVEGFSKLAKPLNTLVSLMYQRDKKKTTRRTSKNLNIEGDWTTECQTAFNNLKTALTQAPVLGYADFKKPFILEIDASFEGLGAVLSQEQKDGKTRPVAYASRSLHPAERNMKNYSSFKLELLGLKWAVCEKFRCYLLGSSVTVYTDNNPLSHLQTAKLGAVEQRWAAELAAFDLDLKYKTGKTNQNADSLSRKPGSEPAVHAEEYVAVSCTVKTELQPQSVEWEEFEQDLFECDEGDAMAHCVSRDLKMGAGIALEFRDAFNNVDILKKQEKKVGEVAILPAGESFIYYLVTKEEFHDKPSYATLASSVQAMKDHCISNDVKSLAMPRIGCGLDGLDWKEVTAILKTVFMNTGIKIKIYTPPVSTQQDESLQLAQVAECAEIWEAACRSVLVESAAFDKQSHIEKLEIRKEQDEDEIVACIKTEVKTGRQLTRKQKERYLQDPEYKAMQKEGKKLRVINDILYREAEILGQNYRQAIIPRRLRPQVLYLAHQEHGHQGADRTFQTLRLRAYWPGMMKDIENHCKMCERCQVAKESGVKAFCPMGGIIATKPLEVLAVDFTLMEMARDGRENVLVLTCVFTKFSIAVATRDQKASTVARVIIQEWIQRYGLPQRIHSDRGKNFTSKIVAAICEAYGFKKSRTTAYHAQGNGQCERFNRTLHNLLRVLCKEKKERWTEYLSEVTHVYNATPHSATGFSPFYLLFGREPYLPIDMILETQCDDWKRIMPTQWLAEHLQRLQEAHKQASANMKRKMEQRKKKHDKGKEEADIKKGDAVVRRKHLPGRNKIQDAFGERVWMVVQAPGRDGGYYIVEPMEGGTPETVTRSELRRFVTIEQPMGTQGEPAPIMEMEQEEPVSQREEVDDIGETHVAFFTQPQSNRMLRPKPHHPEIRPGYRQEQSCPDPPEQATVPKQLAQPETQQPPAPPSPGLHMREQQPPPDPPLQEQRPPPDPPPLQEQRPPPEPPLQEQRPPPDPPPLQEQRPQLDPLGSPLHLHQVEQPRMHEPVVIQSPTPTPPPRKSRRERRPPDRYSPG